METETITLREGDVYRWYYRAPGDDRAYGRYHCCSNIGIVRGSKLWDTYWMIGTRPQSDGRSFGGAEARGLSNVAIRPDCGWGWRR